MNTGFTYPTKPVSEITKKAPPSAQAIIIAELDVDKSEGMADYYAHSTIRYIAIGWRFSKRESFKQLRAAAMRIPETQHLGPLASSEVEHRENYSMGGGNYLKDGWEHASGWRVRSYDLNMYRNWDREMEDATPELKSDVVATNSGEIQIKHNQEKNGIEVYFPSKPEQTIIDLLKAHGYRWSGYNKCWYTGFTIEKWNYIHQQLNKKEEDNGILH